MKNKKVVIFGVFDFIHQGHLFFIKNAKKEGNNLTIILARDSVVKKLKNKTPKYNQKERLKDLLRVKEVDGIFLGDSKIESYKILKKINPDIIYLGYDQKDLLVNLSLHIKKGNLPKYKLIKGKSYKGNKYHSSILNKQ